MSLLVGPEASGDTESSSDTQNNFPASGTPVTLFSAGLTLTHKIISLLVGKKIECGPGYALTGKRMSLLVGLHYKFPPESQVRALQGKRMSLLVGLHPPLSNHHTLQTLQGKRMSLLVGLRH